MKIMKYIFLTILLTIFCSCSEQKEDNKKVKTSDFTIQNFEEILDFLLSEQSPISDLRKVKKMKISHPGISGKLPSKIDEVSVLTPDGDPKDQLTISVISIDKNELILKVDLYFDIDGSEWRKMLFIKENGI